MNQMMRTKPALFYASDRVRATALKGSDHRLVVSFTGVGKPDTREQAEEFVNTSHMGGRNHVLFVADTLRSWYNTPGTYEEILDLVAFVLAAGDKSDKIYADPHEHHHH